MMQFGKLLEALVNKFKSKLMFITLLGVFHRKGLQGLN